MTHDVSARYLILSINPLASEKTLRICRAGTLLLDLKIRLDEVSPVSEVAVDLARFGSDPLEISCVPEMPVHPRFSEAPSWPAELYHETWRPQVHFSARRGWINDPNGLVRYRGVWHLFFQYNPVGREWGNMHWGHATSTDLLHWREQDIALFPDDDGTMFSGSALVDVDNRLGLNTPEHDALLLFYTCAGDTSGLSAGKPFTQCLAYSVDGGATFQKHARNPLIPQLTAGNRDPKVMAAPGGGHVMALYLEKNQYALLTSDNLLDWTLQQTLDLPEDTECPDFYPLMLTPAPDAPATLPDANRQAPRWILSGAADRYLIGSFDGHAFVPEGAPGRLHWGAHAYAAQSWSDVPASDGRRLRISWNTADIPGTAFNRSMTTPCEMTLQPRAHGPVLCIWPIREFESLRLQTMAVPAATLTPDAPLRLPLAVAPYDIGCSLSWEAGTTTISLSLFGATLTLDPQARALRFLGATVPLPLTEHVLSLRLIVDRHAMELYLDNGSAWLSQGHCLDANLARLEVQAEGGGATVSNLSLSPLRSIWEADA